MHIRSHASLIALLAIVRAVRSDYAHGVGLPKYWKKMAKDVGLDWKSLGFNVTEAMWYYNDEPTCLGWGEFHLQCDYDTRVCAGYNGHSYGYGYMQLMELKDMVDNGLKKHELCPDCDPAPDGEIYVCHDGVKYAAPSGDVQQDFGLPGHMSLTGKGYWMTCDCEEVHRGKLLSPGTYWYNLAEEAGLEGDKVSFLNGVWYYDDQYSCVAKGSSGAACDSISLLCAGDNDTYGYGAHQMHELYQASLLPTGTHAYCPLP